MQVSQDDYKDVTIGFSLCGPDGSLNRQQFQVVMRNQVPPSLNLYGASPEIGPFVVRIRGGQ